MQTGFPVTSHGRSPKSHGGSAVAKQGSRVQDQFVSGPATIASTARCIPGSP